MWTQDTERYAAAAGIRYLSATYNREVINKSRWGIQYIDNKNVFAFHDYDIVLKGVDWLRYVLQNYGPQKKVCIRELQNTGQENVS